MKLNQPKTPAWLLDSEKESDHTRSYYFMSILMAAIFYPLLYVAIQSLSGQGLTHLKNCLVVFGVCLVAAVSLMVLRKSHLMAQIAYVFSACVVTWDCFLLCDESQANAIFVAGTLLAIAAYSHSMTSIRSLTLYVAFVALCATYRLIDSNNWAKDAPIFLIQIAGAATAFPQLLDKRRIAKKLRLSDERMRLLFKNAAAGISHVDDDLNIVSANERFATMLGYPLEDLIGASLDKITPEPERVARRRHFAEFLVSDRLETSVDRSYLKGDGSLGWLRLVIRKLDAAQHGMKGTVAVSIDISQERALMARRDSQKKLLENLAISTSLKDFASKVCAEVEVQIPNLRCNVTRISADGGRLVLVGTHSMPGGFLDAISGGIPISPEGGPCGAAAALEKTTCVTDERGDPLWMPLAPLADQNGIKACWSIPAKRSRGQVVGILSCYNSQATLPSQSQTEFLDEQAALVALAIERNDLLERGLRQQSQVGASAKMAALGAMAAEIAHEIRTPLAVIDGKSDRIAAAASTALDQKTIDDAQAIQRMVRRILKTIEGLRVYSRDSMLDGIERIEFDKIVQQTLDLCRERLRSAGIEVQTKSAKGIHVECYETQLSQVLLNLLNNACDAVADLSEKWIRIEVTHSSEWLEFSVVDSGKVPPQDVAAKMFEPFFTTKPKGQGTGIGLSVSKDIIQAHGGSLTLDPGSPHTRFVVRIPREHLVAGRGAAVRDEAA